MELFDQILWNVAYEDKLTDDEEAFGIFRIPTSTGCLELVKLYPEIPYKPHIHDHCSARFIFLSGAGRLILDGQAYPYSKGSVYDVPAGVLHGFEIQEDTIFLSVQSNPIQDRSTGHIDIRYQ
jgi:quercetin dioxygenase-like cupin family protein